MIGKDYADKVTDRVTEAAEKMFEAYGKAIEPMAPEVPHTISNTYAIVYCDHIGFHVVADLQRKSFVALIGVDVVHCHACELARLAEYHPRICSAMITEMESLTRAFVQERERRERRRDDLIAGFRRDYNRIMENDDE